MMASLTLAFAPATASAQPPEPTADAQADAIQPDAAPPAQREDDVEPPPQSSEHEDVPLAFQEPTPEQRARAQNLRKTGTGLMASGGVVATTGLGLTIAYTVIGDRHQGAAEPVLEKIEQDNAVAQIGGILLVSGIALVAVGGMIFVNSKKNRSRPLARIRVTPALGGLVLSGQF